MSETRFAVEHLGLAARDPQALKEWCRTVLEAKVVFESGQTPPAFLLELPGGLLLEVYAADFALPKTADNKLAGWRHVALRVERIESAREALAKKGVVFQEPVKPAGGGGRVLFFQDPEGNLWHLVERPKGSAT